MSAQREHAIAIQGALSTPMLGIITTPGETVTPSGTGIVIVNGGAQYRAGAHRMFASLARHLAAQGHTVLRFDFPGQGDSPGDPVNFEDTAPHIGAAIDALHQHQPILQHTTLLGLCDGASASLLYLHARPDRRVHRLVLINPWVRSETSLARTQLKHYYRQRLLMPAFWKKLLSGGVGLSALRDLLRQAARAQTAPATQNAPTFQDRMAHAWHAFGGHICLLLSDSDLTAQEFREQANLQACWQQWADKPRLYTVELSHADHTCSSLDTAKGLQQHISNWLFGRTT